MKFLILCLLLVLVTSDTLSILLNALKEAEEDLSEAGNVDDRPDHIGRNRRNYRSSGGNIVRGYRLDHESACPRHSLSVEQCTKWAGQNGKSWERKISSSNWPSGCLVSTDIDENGAPRHSSRIGVYFNNGGPWARQNDQVYLVCPL